jgi:hypothetical protein
METIAPQQGKALLLFLASHGKAPGDWRTKTLRDRSRPSRFTAHLEALSHVNLVAGHAVNPLVNSQMWKFDMPHGDKKKCSAVRK